MFNIDNVYKISNFLTPEERDAFDHVCSKYYWNLGGFSYTTSNLFWKKDLWESKRGNCVEIEQTFRYKIESILNIKTETERLYLNGQAHGQCGSMHADITKEDALDNKYITAVYYVNREWSPENGGFTIIIDSKDEMHIVYPQPNSIVIFDSTLSHVGLEPTMHCKDQRVTLAHKMRIIG